MDFLDPKKQRAHHIRLMIGYVLVGITLILSTVILLFLAYGYGLKKGEVIQNGLVFVSSNPSPASIYLNGELRDTTGTRLALQAGGYTMRLAREGYRDWQRAVAVEGGSVERVDYPLLVPRDLTTDTVASYTKSPTLTAQSPDRRWVLVQQPGKFGSFDVYDLKDPKKITEKKTTVTLPDDLLTVSTAAHTLKVVEWSNDNVHVLMRHDYGGRSEYFLLARDKEGESINLTKTLQLSAAEVPSLQNKKHDSYFIHHTTAKTLFTASLERPARKPLLSNVLSYKSYGNDVVLYATTKGAESKEAKIMLYQDAKSYTIRDVTRSSKYLLDIARYDDEWFVTGGSMADSRVYIYKNPVSAQQKSPGRPLIPASVLKVKNPTHVAFSANTQFIMAERGMNFAVYDAENDRTYSYAIPGKLDAPQTRAAWMDGHRLRLVSGGKVVMFDYDGTNRQELVPSLSTQAPFFDSSYKYLYTFAPQKNSTKVPFTATSLRTPEDQ